MQVVVEAEDAQVIQVEQDQLMEEMVEQEAQLLLLQDQEQAQLQIQEVVVEEEVMLE